MSKRWLSLMLIGLGLVAGIAASGLAGEDEKIPLDQVPARAREALLKLAAGAQIAQVEREKECGMVLYEAEWKVNGHEAEAKVTAEGELVELEETIGSDDLPASVKAVVAKEFPVGTKLECEKVTLIAYEIEAKIDGKEKEIMVLTTGKTLAKKEKKEHDDGDDGEDEEKISLDQVPAAVKATILAEAKDAPIKEVERETKNGQTVYEAEWVVNGQEIEIKVAPDGKLLKKEVEQEGDDDDGDNDDGDDDDDNGK